MRFTRALLGSLLACGALHAQAFTWTLTAGAYSTERDAWHETFDPVTLDPHEATDLAWQGGALFEASVAGITARPPGSIGRFLSVGTSGGQTGPIRVDLGSMPARYYGFLWGSPDDYNHVDFYDGDTLLASLSGGDVFTGPQKANGYQGLFAGGQYFNAFAGPGEVFTGVVFRSTRNAFETDNHAVAFAPMQAARVQGVEAPAQPVPAPASWTLSLLALAAAGALARRRR